MVDRCPICNRLWIKVCKCPRADMECLKGHKWHNCVVHNNVVIGNVDHSIPTNRCTCSIGDTETGGTILPKIEEKTEILDIGAGI